MKRPTALRLEPLESRQLLAGITGGGTEVLSNVVHPNGAIYDQVLMTGASVTVTADPGQITRVSYLDPSGDIVQIEFSGHGSLSIALDADTYKAPAEAANYSQPGVKYVQGLASLTIRGSDATTNLSAFAVGTSTAVGGAGNPIFAGGKTGGNHVADLARLTIQHDASNPNGSLLGGIRAGNVVFSDDSGMVGIEARKVHVLDVVRVGDVIAQGTATPTLTFGEYSQFAAVTVAGGGLRSTSGEVDVSGDTYAYGVSFVDGTDAAGVRTESPYAMSSISWNFALPASGAIVNAGTFDSSYPVGLSRFSHPWSLPYFAPLGPKVIVDEATPALADYLNAASSNGALGARAALRWFQFEGNTYLVVDNNSVDSFVEGTPESDWVLKWTGLHDLTGLPVIGESLYTPKPAPRPAGVIGERP